VFYVHPALYSARNQEVQTSNTPLREAVNCLAYRAHCAVPRITTVSLSLDTTTA